MVKNYIMKALRSHPTEICGLVMKKHGMNIHKKKENSNIHKMLINQEIRCYTCILSDIMKIKSIKNILMKNNKK